MAQRLVVQSMSAPMRRFVVSQYAVALATLAAGAPLLWFAAPDAQASSGDDRSFVVTIDNESDLRFNFVNAGTSGLLRAQLARTVLPFGAEDAPLGSAQLPRRRNQSWSLATTYRGWDAPSPSSGRRVDLNFSVRGSGHDLVEDPIRCTLVSEQRDEHLPYGCDVQASWDASNKWDGTGKREVRLTITGRADRP